MEVAVKFELFGPEAYSGGSAERFALPVDFSVWIAAFANCGFATRMAALLEGLE